MKDRGGSVIRIVCPLRHSRHSTLLDTLPFRGNSIRTSTCQGVWLHAFASLDNAVSESSRRKVVWFQAHPMLCRISLVLADHYYVLLSLPTATKANSTSLLIVYSKLTKIYSIIAKREMLKAKTALSQIEWKTSNEKRRSQERRWWCWSSSDLMKFSTLQK